MPVMGVEQAGAAQESAGRLELVLVLICHQVGLSSVKPEDPGSEEQRTAANTKLRDPPVEAAHCLSVAGSLSACKCAAYPLGLIKVGAGGGNLVVVCLESRKKRG